jgi:hypothetical protein
MKKLSQSLVVILLLTIVSISSAQPRVKIAMWGDSRENLNHACENITSILLKDVTDWDVQVHTGDFTSMGRESDWKRSLHYPGIDSLFMPGKILMCTSNHDCDGKGNKARWDKHTAGILPINSADSTTHFYSWQKGNVHVVCCDAFFADSTTMQRWLDQYVASIPDSDWLIGVWHDPAFADISYKNGYLSKCGSWLKSLAGHGGDFILNGHAHIYVRTKPLSPVGEIDEQRGMVTIINGTGGASWADPVKPNPKIAYTPTEKSFPCITFLTFEGRTVTIQTVDARPESKLQVVDEWKWTR